MKKSISLDLMNLYYLLTDGECFNENNNEIT